MTEAGVPSGKIAAIARKVADILRVAQVHGIAAVMAAVIASALLEFAGVTMVYIIGRMMVGGAGVKIAGAAANARIMQAAIMIAVLYLVKNVAVVLLGIYSQQKVWSWFVKISDVFSSRYLLANYANVVSLGSADINTGLRFTANVVTQLALTARAFADFVVIILLVVLLFAFDPILGPALLGSGVIVLWGVIVPLRRMLRVWGVMIASAELRMTVASNEAFGGLQDTRIFGIFSYMRDRLLSATRDLADAVGKSEGIADIPRAATETALMTIFAVGAVVVTMSGRTLADLVPFGAALLAAVMRILPSFNRIAQCYTTWVRTEPSLEMVHRVMFDPLLAPEVAVKQSAPMSFTQVLEVENISFSYPGLKEPSIADVNFRIEHGQLIGLAGLSGSGKTTLTGLLLGLFKPGSGRILADGSSIHDDLSAWRANTAIVAQSPFLVDGSIASNIALAVADDQIDRGRLMDAVRKASLDKFIAGLPAGQDTRVGERGVLLSGGERQRIAIARALYFGRSFIVLDEATSALDPLTEREIVVGLEALRGSVTIIVIAHRLTTLRTCDRILVMEKGRIIQDGSHADLVGGEGRFREMLERMSAD
jgi:ABC-type multidrug transport system fused ATPase/permease subunit